MQGPVSVHMTQDPDAAWRSALADPLEIERFEPISSSVALEVAAVSACGALRSYNSDHFLAVRLGRTEDTLISSLPDADVPTHFAEYGYAMAVADGRGDRGGGGAGSRPAPRPHAHTLTRSRT